MTKEELREVIEAVVASQTELMDAAFERFMPFLQPGKLMPGLVFKVEADEVRKLLRSRATGMREDAAEGEAGMEAAVEDIRKSFNEQHALVPGNLGVEEIVEGTRRRGIEKIRHLRESADTLDWQALHLDERTYMLSRHDLDAIMPEHAPSSDLLYDPAAGFRAAAVRTRRVVTAAR